MLATTERVELIEYAEDLAKKILQSDLAEQYRICLYNLQSSDEAQRKIRHFVRLKDQYDEVQRFGKYHPDYKRIMSRIREAKREVDLDPDVAAFKLAENDLQSLLDQVSILIGGAVSQQIKVPTGNPFFDTSGCGGGGACGCSA